MLIVLGMHAQDAHAQFMTLTASVSSAEKGETILHSSYIPEYMYGNVDWFDEFCKQWQRFAVGYVRATSFTFGYDARVIHHCVPRSSFMEARRGLERTHREGLFPVEHVVWAPKPY